MPLPPCIETGRLRLRPRRLNDIDAIVEMDLNPDVYRYLRDCTPHETSLAIPDETTVEKFGSLWLPSSSPPDLLPEPSNGRNRQEFLPGLAGLIAKPEIVGLPRNRTLFSISTCKERGAWGSHQKRRRDLGYGFT